MGDTGNKEVTYENRYKHKLNMLEPGVRMLKYMCLLVLLGIIFSCLSLKTISYVLYSLAGILLIILFVLLGIEAHQDKVLEEIALKEKKG